MKDPNKKIQSCQQVRERIDRRGKTSDGVEVDCIRMAMGVPGSRCRGQGCGR